MVVGFSCSEACDKMWSEKRAENDPVTLNLVFESVKESTKSDQKVTSRCINSTLKGKQVMRIENSIILVILLECTCTMEFQNLALREMCSNQSGEHVWNMAEE